MTSPLDLLFATKMTRFLSHLFLIWLTFQTLVSSNVSTERPVNQSSTEVNSFQTSVMCNKTSLVVNFQFREPFFGVIYSNQIFSSLPSQCRAYGNGSEVVHFVTNSRQCGVNSIEDQSDSQMELVLYVQNDRNIQQASDEKVEVKCAPQELLLTGVVSNRGTPQTQHNTSKFNGKSLYGGSHLQVHRMLSHNFTLTYISDAIDCRMDVMKGRLPFLKPIDGFVDLGQDVTVLIKIREMDGIDSMISRCYAHDGTHLIKQELTNNDGCSIDKGILPDFQLMPNPPSDFKVYFTTFPAFKFPDRTNLNIQCTVFICNTTCPQVNADWRKIQCDNTRPSSPPLHRIKRRSNTWTASSYGDSTIIMDKNLTALTADHNNDSESSDSPLTGVGVSNSTLLPIGDSIDNQNETNSKTIDSIHKVFIARDQTQCLTSKTLLIVAFALMCALISLLTIASLYGFKAHDINQKQLISERNESTKHYYNGFEGQDYQTTDYKPLEGMTDITI